MTDQEIRHSQRCTCLMQKPLANNVGNRNESSRLGPGYRPKAFDGNLDTATEKNIGCHSFPMTQIMPRDGLTATMLFTNAPWK